MRTSKTSKLIVLDNVDAWVLNPCECGHAKAAHEGHTTPIGMLPSTQCSQGCGCKAYTSKRRRKNDIERAKGRLVKHKLKEWVKGEWGDRCPDFEANCSCCQAWQSVDYLFQWLDK